MRSTGERQRQAQRMAMYDLSSRLILIQKLFFHVLIENFRTINLDPNRPRQNNRLLGHTSERSLTNSYEVNEIQQKKNLL